MSEPQEPHSSLELFIINMMAANGFFTRSIVPPVFLNVFYHKEVTSHVIYHLCKDEQSFSVSSGYSFPIM